MLDAIVIGAGAAGLAAARELNAAGLRVVILEARDRIGGRIFTTRRPDSILPIELGADFIHGRPDETWNIVRDAKLTAYDVPQQHWQLIRGRLQKLDDFWSRIDPVMQKLKRVHRDRDMSFENYLAKYFSRTKDRAMISLARNFIEGFDASDASKISAVSIRESGKDEEKIDGDKLFRIADGYDRVIAFLADGCDVRLNRIVRKIRWRKGRVEIGAFKARRAIITLPLGVLQAGDVEFQPDISAKRQAASMLVMGSVTKIVCLFRERFWEDDDRLNDMSFMHGQNIPLQTWWTMSAVRAPILCGWSGGPRAGAIANPIDAVVQSLTKLLHRSERFIRDQLIAAKTHDWQSDRFARGAYSYVGVGGSGAMKKLAAAIDDTLFFAGEATHWEGMSGTVAGAIASGQRAAKEILDKLR